MNSWVVFFGGEAARTWRSLTSVVGPICPKLALPRKGIDYDGPVTEAKFSRPASSAPWLNVLRFTGDGGGARRNSILRHDRCHDGTECRDQIPYL
jgi:hypothetical protein